MDEPSDCHTKLSQTDEKVIEEIYPKSHSQSRRRQRTKTDTDI